MKKGLLWGLINMTTFIMTLITTRAFRTAHIIRHVALFSLLALASCRSTPPATQTEITAIPAIEEKNNIPSAPEPSAEDLAQAAQYRQQGLEYRGQGLYEDAIAVLQESVTLDSNNLSGQVILGWTMHLADQADNAIKVLQRALAQDADYVPALNALGIVYLVDGQLEAAVDTHTQAVTLKPDNEIGYYNLSLAYHRLEDFERAIANAQQAVNLKPGNPHPLVALALAHWDNQDTTAAQQAYQQAIDLDANYWESWHLDHLAQAGFSPDQIQTTDELRQTL